MLNAFNIPIVGYGGENDPQLQASTNIVKALETLGFGMKTEGLITRGEGIDFLRVVGAKMGHKIDPASAKILEEFHNNHAVKGVDLNPPRIRFVTYTVKYGKAAWLSVELLRAEYKRTEVDAEIQGALVVVSKAENVAVLAVERHAGERITIEGQTFDLETAVKGLLPNVYFRRNDGGGWRQLGYQESRGFEEKTRTTANIAACKDRSTTPSPVPFSACAAAAHREAPPRADGRPPASISSPKPGPSACGATCPSRTTKTSPPRISPKRTSSSSAILARIA